MMAEKEVILSPEGLKKLEAELEYLKSVRRREVAERIKLARQFGDINENSEYDDAKNEQAFIEGRIITLEKQLRNAKVITGSGESPDQVTIGSTVKLKDLQTGEMSQFTIVGSAEADPSKQRISNESPVGKALLGQKAGSVVKVNVPVGVLDFQITEISH